MKSLAFVIALAATAHAESTTSRRQVSAMSPAARAHFDRGTEAYEIGDYASAIDELQAGRKLDPHPDFLYALAQAYRKQGDCTRAVEQYVAFLDTHPPAPEAARVRANITRCSRITTRPPEPEPSTPSPPPPSEPAFVEPPRAEPATSIAAAPRAELRMRARSTHVFGDVPGGVLAAAGIVSAGVGAMYFVLGERDARSANAADTLVARDRFSATSHHERMIGTGCVIAGGVLGAAAVVRYVIVSRREPEPQISVRVSPSEVMAVWSGRF